MHVQRCMNTVSGSVRQILRQGARPSTHRSCDIVSRVLASLARLHRAGRVHGDVCAERVMIDELPGGAFAVRLVDAPAARARSRVAADDLYDAALLLRELVEPLTSTALQRVIARALASDPRARFANADELGDALAAASIPTDELDAHVTREHQAILAAVRKSAYEEATRRAVEVAHTLACHARETDAIAELEGAARGLRYHTGSSRRGRRLLEQVEEELARLLHARDVEGRSPAEPSWNRRPAACGAATPVRG